MAAATVFRSGRACRYIWNMAAATMFCSGRAWTTNNYPSVPKHFLVPPSVVQARGKAVG